MLHAGLTGGIATGKSTVAKMFARKGAYLIYFDLIAHEIIRPAEPAWEKIVQEFGSEILTTDQSIDRDKLGKIVFHDSRKRRLLEEITHPAITRKWHDKLNHIYQLDPEAIILSETPLLFEKRMQSSLDAVILVYCPANIQIKRNEERNNLDETEAKKRLSAQLPIDEKIKYSDFVIYNDGTLETTKKQVEAVWQELQNLIQP